MKQLRSIEGPRLVRLGEQSASAWLSQLCFSSEPSQEPPSVEPITVDDTLESKPRQGETYAYFEHGLPISQISIFWADLFLYGQRVRAGFIGGVCTHPEYRGLRLAGKLLEHCTTRLVQGGARVMIVSGGRGLYQRAGCVPMGQFANITLRSLPEPMPMRLFTLRIATEADGAVCSKLYQAEPAHFGRPPGRYAGYLEPEPGSFNSERLVIEWGGEVVAYFQLNTPWDFVGNAEARVRCIFEYAGSRLALADGLKQAIERFHLQELQAPIPWQDIDLWASLQPAQPSWTSLPDHTLRIVDFPGLMRDLRAYQQALLPDRLRRGLRFEQYGPLLAGAGGDVYTIRRGSDMIGLDGAAMTRLVFGPPNPQFHHPLPGVLAEITEALFPLPAFFTGLDYH